MVKAILLLFLSSLLSFAHIVNQYPPVELNLRLKFLIDHKFVQRPDSSWLYLPKRKEVLVFGANSTSVFGLETGGKIKELSALHIPKGHFLRDLSPDETKLVTYGFLDKEAELWDISHGNLIVAFPKRNKEIDTVVWDSNSRYLLFNNSPIHGEKAHEVFDAQTGRVISTIVTRLKSTAQFSPDGKAVLTCETDITYRRTDQLKLWNVVNGALIREFPLTFYAQTVRATFSPDGKYVLVSDVEKDIHVIDSNSGETFKVIDRGSDIAGYSRLLFSPDGRYLLLNRERWRGFFKRDEVWFEVYDTVSYTLKSEIRTQRPGKDQVEEHQVLWRPDSNAVVSAGDFYQKQYGAECWDTVTGRQKFVLSPLIAKHASGLLDSGYDYYDEVSFSEDSRLLITSNTSKNDNVRIWDAETGKLLKALNRTEGYYRTTPDDKYVTKIEADGRTISLYEIVAR